MPQEKADLPNSVKGAALWLKLTANARGNIPPASYHVLHDGMYHPIEFVNNAWYFINWDDGKFLGYWVSPDHRIEAGSYQLGWLGAATEAETLCGSASFMQIRERAESESTQPKETSLVSHKGDDNDLVDHNPEQTKALAESLFYRFTIANIVKEVEPSQPREHYMPTTLPSAYRLTLVDVNPIHVRSTVTAPENIAATQGVTQLITNVVKIDGQLKGKVLETFNGDRTKAETFINSFNLFWMTNDVTHGLV